MPAAIINIINAVDVAIEGDGLIDGQGPFWWDLYWGKDKKNGLRKDYDSKGLRWLADYEIKRPRNMCIYESKNIEIKNLTFQKSGFWNLQITYSENVVIDDVKISKNDGPSTDGIDIDSSKFVTVKNCQLACGDDCTVIKSGRDGDGYRVNRASENIEIMNCNIYEGYGIVIGSEISGGVRNIHIHDIYYENTSCGFRMKSSAARGGYIENISVERLFMKNVQFPFSWLMNWHPEYNHKQPSYSEKHLSSTEKSIAAQIPESEQKSLVHDVTIKDVKAILDDNYNRDARAFDISAYVDKPMKSIKFENINIEANEFGKIVAVRNLCFNDVNVSIKKENNSVNDNFDNR